MRKILSTLILYIVLLGSIGLTQASASFAATPCQVLYGGGQICQNQKEVTLTYKVVQEQPTPTATPINNSFPPTKALPSTGTSVWGLLLIGMSGVGGVLLLLL